MGVLDKTDKLDEIKKVCESWKSSRHRLRSSHAMVKINNIMETEEILPFPDRVIP